MLSFERLESFVIFVVHLSKKSRVPTPRCVYTNVYYYYRYTYLFYLNYAGMYALQYKSLFLTTTSA